MTVRGMVLEAPRRLVERRFPVPEISQDDGVLRIEACGLCGTDHEQYSGILGGGFAFIPGHEVVGVIDAIGPAAMERWGSAPAIGSRSRRFRSEPLESSRSEPAVPEADQDDQR